MVAVWRWRRAALLESASARAIGRALPIRLEQWRADARGLIRAHRALGLAGSPR